MTSVEEIVLLIMVWFDVFAMKFGFGDSLVTTLNWWQFGEWAGLCAGCGIKSANFVSNIKS